jgi:LysM repeat protein
MTHSLYHSSVAAFPAMIRPPVADTPADNSADAHCVPNFAARRIAALTIVVATVIFLLTVLVLLAGLGGRPASASQTGPAISSTPAVHVASAGDTLWSIAQEHHGEVALERYVDALVDINGGTDVQIGEAVRLP